MAFGKGKQPESADLAEVEVVRTPSGKFTMRGAEVGASPEFDLLKAVGPGAPRPVQLAVLQDVVGLKLREIAFVASVTEQSVRNWKKQDTSGRPEAYDDLRAVVEHILYADAMEPKLIGSWLRSRNLELKYERPLAAIKAGEFQQVLEAAESFIAFSPPVEPEAAQAEAAPAEAEDPRPERADRNRRPAADAPRTRTYMQ